jgi:hypothetical protein
LLDKHWNSFLAHVRLIAPNLRNCQRQTLKKHGQVLPGLLMISAAISYMRLLSIMRAVRRYSPPAIPITISCVKDHLRVAIFSRVDELKLWRYDWDGLRAFLKHDHRMRTKPLTIDQ